MSNFMRPDSSYYSGSGGNEYGESSTKRKFHNSEEEEMREKRAKMQAKKREDKLYAQQNRLKVIKIPLLETPSKREVFMRGSKCKVSVCLDLSWILAMDVRDLSKIQRQIRWIYVANNHAKSPLQVHLTKYSGPIRAELQKRGTTPRWDFHYHEGHYLDVFPKEKLVYLSSNSDNVLDKPDDDKVYILGALEGNRDHLACYNTALSEGLATARLPVNQYFKAQNKNDKRVLSMLQVYSILLRVTQGHSYKEAVGIVFKLEQELLDLAEYKDYIDPSAPIPK